jgi:hypothetical protein
MKNFIYYVALKRADGVEGGKLPVIVEVKEP